VLPALLVIASDPQQASLITALCEEDAGVVVHRALRDANAEFSVYGASSEMTVELWRDIAAPQLDVREHRNLWLKPQAIVTPLLRSESQTSLFVCGVVRVND